MKKWIATLSLGGLLLCGTWASAQQSDALAAAAAIRAGGQAGVVQVQADPVAISGGESGAIVVAGGAMVPPPDLPAQQSGEVIRGRFLSGPDGEMHPVVTAGAMAVPAGVPGDGQNRVITIRRGPGAPPIPPAAMQVPDGGGPMWISRARAIMAGKAEKTAFLGVVTTRADATLRSQLKLKAGLVVDVVEPKSSAEAAGLQVHDIIEKCDEQWLINPAQFIGLVRMFYKPGATVTLTVLREGQPKKIAAKLEERETYAMDEDGNAFYARTGVFDPSNPQGPGLATLSRTTQFEGPVQRITARALGAAPLAPGFVATFGDDKQQLMISIRDGHQVLTAKDPDGKQIFQGPIDTPEQRKLVPENVRKKLEEMEKIKVKIRAPNFQDLPPQFDNIQPAWNR